MAFLIKKPENDSIVFTPDQIATMRCQKPVLGLTHGFYRYPARFSPQLARTLIDVFTDPEDLVLDPFCGGATTLVEAATMGRESIGIDVNPLAVFLARAKTQPIGKAERDHIHLWTNRTSELTLTSHEKPSNMKWQLEGYHKHLNSRTTWRIKKSIELLLAHVNKLSDSVSQTFVRCAILRTGQWALDGRKEIPSVSAFRSQFRITITEMLKGMAEFTDAMENSDSFKKPPLCLHCSASKIHREECLKQTAPKLVLTSPPYPGVHILYHRWQIHGRQETPAPYWIANELDGNSESFYTFGSRRKHDTNTYYDCLKECLKSVKAISTNQTTIAQIVGFSDPRRQFQRFLTALSDIGLQEVIPSISGSNRQNRIWRKVPRRKWYAEQQTSLSSSYEVLLFHRLGK